MFTAAKDDGITGWHISAGYRSYATSRSCQQAGGSYVSQGTEPRDA
jgi:hypothetical protein